MRTWAKEWLNQRAIVGLICAGLCWLSINYMLGILIVFGLSLLSSVGVIPYRVVVWAALIAMIGVSVGLGALLERTGMMALARQRWGNESAKEDTDGVGDRQS